MHCPSKRLFYARIFPERQLKGLQFFKMFSPRGRPRRSRLDFATGTIKTPILGQFSLAILLPGCSCDLTNAKLVPLNSCIRDLKYVLLFSFHTAG